MGNVSVITHERLRELLHYDPETGVFTWRVTRNRLAAVGKVAGYQGKLGYTRIRVDGRPYLAHRLAWLYVHGSFPVAGIDHVNGVTCDNSIKNLREANSILNGQNQRGPHSRSTSGYLGVHFDRERGKWAAEIRVSKKLKRIGRFNCPTAAYLLGYLPAKRRLHEFGTI